MLVIAMTAFSSIAFGLVNATYGGTGGFLGRTLSHFAAAAGLEASVFFGIIALQCAVLNTVGAVVAQRLAVLLQIALVVGVLQMPLLLPLLSMPQAPAWAPVIGLGMCATTLVLYGASYRRMMRLALEGTGASTARRSDPPTVGAARGFDHRVLTSGTRRVRLRIAHRRAQPPPPDASCRLGRARSGDRCLDRAADSCSRRVEWARDPTAHAAGGATGLHRADACRDAHVVCDPVGDSCELDGQDAAAGSHSSGAGRRRFRPAGLRDPAGTPRVDIRNRAVGATCRRHSCRLLRRTGIPARPASRHGSRQGALHLYLRARQSTIREALAGCTSPPFPSTPIRWRVWRPRSCPGEAST